MMSGKRGAGTLACSLVFDPPDLFHGDAAPGAVATAAKTSAATTRGIEKEPSGCHSPVVEVARRERADMLDRMGRSGPDPGSRDMGILKVLARGLRNGLAAQRILRSESPPRSSAGIWQRERPCPNAFQPTGSSQDYKGTRSGRNRCQPYPAIKLSGLDRVRLRKKAPGPATSGRHPLPDTGVDRVPHYASFRSYPISSIAPLLFDGRIHDSEKPRYVGRNRAAAVQREDR